MKELPYKILLVEDDPTVLDFLEICFSGELSIAGSIKEAWEKLKKNEPDLVILDRGLPDGDGIRLCEEIRRDPELHSLPVLMLTCKDGLEDKVLGLK
ncbi:MAG: response regulator [Elusimicrobiota bacterium]|nr:response regulator [Elusimicrobiota bacterium]